MRRAGGKGGAAARAAKEGGRGRGRVRERGGAHWATTSWMRSFWPLYVVMIEMREAAMPCRRMYMKVCTTISASARFWM